MNDKEIRKLLIERFNTGAIFGASVGVLIGYIIKGWLG